MKRKILSIAKRFGCEISNYRSYKSDMGYQCFDFVILYCGSRYNFDYGYPIGGGENNLLNEFSEQLAVIDKEPTR
jgi:hypothetical protein